MRVNNLNFSEPKKKVTKIFEMILFVGKDFIQNFMTRFHLSFRTPESTSVARLMAFNKTRVGYFFDLLKELLAKYKFEAGQIFNVDETGITTVPTKLPKVISPKGVSRVSKVSSAERGELVTAVCCMSATGVHVPPAFIFPRLRVKDSYKNGAPQGSLFLGNSNGWMTKEYFLKFLEHFVKHVRPSAQYPILLIMDNHASHTSLESINYCREHHIIMLGIPTHTSGRLQPLDVGVYAPIKLRFGAVCDNWMVANPGKVIRIDNLVHLFNCTYGPVATVGNAVSAFSATGISPLNPLIFKESDFAPSLTTDRTPTSQTAATQATLITPENITVLSTPDRTTATPETDLPGDNPLPQPLLISEPEPQPEPQCVASTSAQSALPPLPHIERPVVTKPRKKLPSLHLSSTPVKEELEQRDRQKKIQEKKLKKIFEGGWD